MRIMIIGQKWLATELLKLCLSRGLSVVAVAAPEATDRLALAAASAGLPVFLAPKRLLPCHMPTTGVDLLVCAHAHCYVTAEVRAEATLGTIGYHPSLLPRHRGRDAIRWAIHMGERVTGGTVYWLTDKADAGPIAAQDWCFIRPDDTADSLWRRELAPMGLKLFGEVLSDLLAGRKVAVPQDEKLATWEPAFRVKPLAQA